MPEVPNRGDLEAELGRAFGRLGVSHKRAIIAALGDPPDFSKLTPSLWAELGTEMTATLEPILERVYLEAAERVLESTSVGVDWAQVNIQASSWAKQYTFDLVKGINGNTQEALRQFIGDYFQGPVPLDDLRDKLAVLYGPVRADMIASTEVTRAAAQGELGVAEELRKEGLEMEIVWLTNRDDLVCPICGPLDGQTREEFGDPPPAHVNCRCSLKLEAIRG